MTQMGMTMSYWAACQEAICPRESGLPWCASLMPIFGKWGARCGLWEFARRLNHKKGNPPQLHTQKRRRGKTNKHKTTKTDFLKETKKERKKERERKTGRKKDRKTERQKERKRKRRAFVLVSVLDE
jgi:hypothetical protein